MKGNEMSTTTDRISAIVASVPANSTAGRVMGKGVHFEKARKAIGHVDVRASINPLPIDRLKAVPEALQDIVGNTFGRWKVIGLAATQPSKRKWDRAKDRGRWVVKCSCGRYEHRMSKAIRRAPQTDDCCWECQTLKAIKRTYRQLGGKPIAAFAGDKEAKP